MTSRHAHISCCDQICSSRLMIVWTIGCTMILRTINHLIPFDVSSNVWYYSRRSRWIIQLFKSAINQSVRSSINQSVRSCQANTMLCMFSYEWSNSDAAAQVHSSFILYWRSNSSDQFVHCMLSNNGYGWINQSIKFTSRASLCLDSWWNWWSLCTMFWLWWTES